MEKKLANIISYFFKFNPFRTRLNYIYGKKTGKYYFLLASPTSNADICFAIAILFRLGLYFSINTIWREVIISFCFLRNICNSSFNTFVVKTVWSNKRPLYRNTKRAQFSIYYYWCFFLWTIYYFKSHRAATCFLSPINGNGNFSFAGNGN